MVKRGRIICEIAGIDEVAARAVMKKCSYKLSMRTRFVVKGKEEEVAV